MTLRQLILRTARGISVKINIEMDETEVDEFMDKLRDLDRLLADLEDLKALVAEFTNER
jgi:hypothetical protein